MLPWRSMWSETDVPRTYYPNPRPGMYEQQCGVGHLEQAASL
jgi:hypothetical protein